MGGRDSAVGPGDPRMRGPGAIGRVGSAWARVTLGQGPGAPACHVSIEGESPGRALPSLGSW